MAKMQVRPLNPRYGSTCVLRWPFPFTIWAVMKRPIGQRIAFAAAIFCYAAAFACACAAFVYQSTVANDPIRASLMAAVVFFVGCGVVLHTIGTARLKGLLSGSDHVDNDS